MKKVSASTKKATASVFRQAAERIDMCMSTWSCCAVEQVLVGEDVSKDWSPETKRYRGMFATRDEEISIWDFDDAGGRPVRVLALCFAAAMAETGDL